MRKLNRSKSLVKQLFTQFYAACLTYWAAEAAFPCVSISEIKSAIFQQQTTSLMGN